MLDRPAPLAPLAPLAPWPPGPLAPREEGVPHTPWCRECLHLHLPPIHVPRPAPPLGASVGPGAAPRQECRGMPRTGAGPDLGDLALPQGWDQGKDFDGKVYYIDHHNQKTTWVDPRDR